MKVPRVALPLFALFVALLCLTLFPGVVVSARPGVWWDASYAFRQQMTVTTGPNSPANGYNGYTARVILDTASLAALGKSQLDCDDLRVLWWNGASWVELARHVLGCNTPTTDVRFKLQADIAASASDDNYYIYYGNPTAGAPTALGTTNVYLWWDDASINRSTDYTRGRIDPWQGTGWDNSLVWNAAGYYTYNNGDNFSSGYRREIGERDVYIEAEFYHTGCFPSNMTTGLMVRGIIAAGTGGSETADHYYASNRAHQASCGSGYNHDGDIMETDRGTVAINGVDPPAMAINQWRKQALAVWVINPTNLKFWDSNTGWATAGWPGDNIQVSGNDSNDYEGAGFVAVMTAQDAGRLRNILVRRYVEPEPATSLSAEQLQPTSTSTAVPPTPTSTAIPPTPTSTPSLTPTPTLTGLPALTAIRGFVFLDDNRDGKIDPGEAGLGAINVHIVSNGWRSTSVTAADGGYEFCCLTSGKYEITVDMPQGYAITTVSSLTVELAGDSPVVGGVDFGLAATLVVTPLSGGLPTGTTFTDVVCGAIWRYLVGHRLAFL